MLLLTTDEYPGKEIKEVKGLVRAATVQSKNVFKDIGAGFKSIVGGKLGSYEKMMYAAIEVSEKEIIAQAEALGANAIVGYRMGTSTTAPGSAGIFAYGTAVIVK